MLEQLLRAEDCAVCKWCCKFNDADISEKPQIFPETAEYLRQRFPEIKLVEEDGILYFDMPRVFCEKDNEYQYTCPMLRDGEGCALGEMRMLDCKIWPFRLMECSEGKAITISDECGVMNEKKDSELLEELLDRGVAELIFKAAKERPVMIKPYLKNHRVILREDKITGNLPCNSEI